MTQFEIEYKWPNPRCLFTITRINRYCCRIFRYIFLALILIMTFSCIKADTTVPASPVPIREEGSIRIYELIDIPVPTVLTRGPNQFMIRNSDSIGGIMTFSGRVEPESLHRFFVANIPKQGWSIVKTDQISNKYFTLLSKRGQHYSLICIIVRSFTTDVIVWYGNKDISKLTAILTKDDKDLFNTTKRQFESGELLASTSDLYSFPSKTTISSSLSRPILTEEREDRRTEKHVSPVPSHIDFGDYFALVIGNNNYLSLPKLATAMNDAQVVGHVLKHDYGFSVKLLIDATRSDILMALSRLRKKLTERDNLLIYYAGHGWLDKAADEGYWLPSNATRDNEVNWISNANITSTIRAMEAKHVMIVADSCYSGKLVRGIHIKRKTPDYLTRISQKKGRVVLSSGGLEPVADSGGKGEHSVFASAFIRALRENHEVMDGTELFTRIRRAVMLNSDQTPEYADIRKAGHDGGNFLFVRQTEK